MKDDSPFVVAGLWEGWKDPANGERLRTYTIITGEPNEFVREIHTRISVILPEEHHEAWLSGEAGKEVLVPYPADRMKAWPTSARVNSAITTTPTSWCRSNLNPWRDRILRRCCFDAHPRTEAKADGGGTCGLRGRLTKPATGRMYNRALMTGSGPYTQGP
jgi:hypothetical protein